MMAVILNSVILDSDTAILDSDTWLSSLRFTQKHSSSTLTLTDTNSIWLKLIHSYSTWWWWPSWILPSWIQLLASWIQTSCFLLSDSLKNTLTPLWLWLKLIQSDSNSFILTQLNDGGHLEFGHLGFRNLSFSSQTHSHLPRLVPTICTKSFTHSFSLTLMMAAILNSAMFDSDPDMCIQTPCYLLSVTLKNTLPPLWFWLKLIQSDSNSFILT